MSLMTRQGISRTILSLLVASALLISTVAIPAADVSRPGRMLGNVSGIGDVQLRGIALKDLGTVFSGDSIRTGSKAYATVILSNGTRAEIGVNTEFVVNQSTDATTHFALATGTMGFTASRSPLAISLANYKFEPKAGSSGYVGFIGANTASVNVNRGSVTVKDTKSKQSIVFPNGQYLLDLKGTGPIAKLVSTMPALPLPGTDATVPAARRELSRTSKVLLLVAGAGAVVTTVALVTRNEKCEGTCATAKAATQDYAARLVAEISTFTNLTPAEAAIINDIKAVQAELNKPNLTPAQVSELIERLNTLRIRLTISRVVATTNDASASGG